MNELVGFGCQVCASYYHPYSEANLAEACLREARCTRTHMQIYCALQTMNLSALS